MIHDDIHVMLSSDELTYDGARHLSECADCRVWREDLVRIRRSAPGLFEQDEVDLGARISEMLTVAASELDDGGNRRPTRTLAQSLIAACIAATLIAALIALPLHRSQDKLANTVGPGVSARFEIEDHQVSPKPSSADFDTRIVGETVLGERLHATATMRDANGTETFEVWLIGNEGWARIPSYHGGRLLVSFPTVGAGTDFFHPDPKRFRGTPFHDEGTETRGNEVVRHLVGVLNHYPQQQSPRPGLMTYSDGRADLYVGDSDGYLREMRSNQTTSYPHGEIGPQLIFTSRLFDFGLPVNIGTPAGTDHSVALMKYVNEVFTAANKNEAKGFLPLHVAMIAGIFNPPAQDTSPSPAAS